MNVIPYYEIEKNQDLTRVAFSRSRAHIFRYYPGLSQLAACSGTKVNFQLIEAYFQAIDDRELYGEADRIATRIRALAQNSDLRDEDEPAPPQNVIEEAIRMICETSNRMASSMPSAQVATFFGELNITWKFGNQIVRFACFPNRPSVLQIGSLSMPVGSFQTQANPTPELLAERLNPFAANNDPEDSPFPG